MAAVRSEKPGKKVSSNAVWTFAGIEDSFPSMTDAMVLVC